MNRIATHAVELPAPPVPGDASQPEWIHLLPAGTFKGADGRGPWHVANAAELIAASSVDGDLPVDEAHAIDLGAASGQPGPARGWVSQLEARNTGIWGFVTWNRAGQALREDRAYKGISPTFTYAKNGKVLRLLRAALTNVPNLTDLATLHHQENSDMDLLAQLRQLHGLAADADADAAIAACRAAHEAVGSHATVLNAIAEAAGISPGLNTAAFTSAIAAKCAAAGDTAKLTADLVALQTRLDTLTTTQARKDATAVVDAAMNAGKPITKAMREHYIDRHIKDASAVEAELAALPALNAGGIVPRDPAVPVERTAAQIALLAREHQDKERAAGREVSIAQAVQFVEASSAAAA